MTESEVRVNERMRLAAALRQRAADSFAEAGRLASEPTQARAALSAILESAMVRYVAVRIEEGLL
jgi:hypothetical protein